MGSGEAVQWGGRPRPPIDASEDQRYQSGVAKPYYPRRLGYRRAEEATYFATSW